MKFNADLRLILSGWYGIKIQNYFVGKSLP